MIEKWRVIDESGATHEVDVTSDDSAHRLWATRAVYRGIEQKTFPTTTARRSVLRWAVASDVQPVEILAPGQPSRDESIASALAIGHDDSVRLARINARCAEAAAFARGAAEMQRRAIAACEACASDVTGTVSDPDEAAQLAVAACVAAVRVTPWPTMTVNDAPAPSWGPLPTAAEVDAHVARSSPARASDGAPWVYRCAESSGDYVAIIYLRTQKDEVTSCEPGHAVWYRLRAWHRKSQWRPVDRDGMPVERVR